MNYERLLSMWPLLTILWFAPLSDPHWKEPKTSKGIRIQLSADYKVIMLLLCRRIFGLVDVRRDGVTS